MNEVIRIDPSRDLEPASSAVQQTLLPLPTPGSLGVSVRNAVPGDIAFIDHLQKLHNKAVGWMPTKQLEGHIAKGHVIVAETTDVRSAMCDLQSDQRSSIADCRSHIPVGYCIGVDKYFKREDTGIIYQMNITPGRQRGLVGATLLKAMFDRWPYGVRLCCCWCAQDLAANRYWEAMGFVPLAFRAGSRKRDRVHIFWQKKIRLEDQNTSGGWWYPSQTGSGAIREDRIVLPIPPGTHWSDAKPKILPGVAALIEEAAAERKAIEAPAQKEARVQRRKSDKAKPAEKPVTVKRNGLTFDIPKPGEPLPEEKAQKMKKEKPPRVNKKNDPRLIAAARELRDRWMEQVAAEPGLLEATSGGAPGSAKYEVARRIEAGSTMSIEKPTPLLDVA